MDRTDLLSLIMIRKAFREDLIALEWNGEYKHFRRLYQDIYHSVERGNAIMWIAELPGRELVGQLFVQLNSVRLELANGRDRAYIYGFRIKNEYQNLGLGSKMLSMAECDLHKRGYAWISLNVNQDNQDARRLYERRGYRVVAIEAGDWHYTDDRGQRQEVHEPAWRMQKKLTSCNEVKVLLE